MAILDVKLSLSDAQAITATDRSEGEIDLGVLVGIDGSTQISCPIGAGTPLYLSVRTNTAFTTSSETIYIDLYTHTVSMNVNGSDGTKLLELQESTAVSASPYNAAGIWIFRGIIPYESVQRFIALRYTCSATPEAGKFDAWISLDAQSTLGIGQEI